MNSPVVSVLLPVRNGCPYLREAIQSVLDQSFSDWELLISENGSSDASWEVIQSFQDARIKVWRQAESLSMPDNWNFVLQRATGTYWLVLGADDVLEKNHLQTRVELHAANPKLVLSCGSFTEINPAGQTIAIQNLAAGEFESAAQIIRRLLAGNPLNILTVFCQTAPVKNRRLGFDAHYPWMPDWVLWLELLLDAEGVRWCPANTVRYRTHPDSMTSAATSGSWALESSRLRVDLLEKYPEKFRALGFDPAVEIRVLTQDLWLSAQQMFRARQFAGAKAAWRLFRRYHGWRNFFGYVCRFFYLRLTGAGTKASAAVGK